jgi:beta-glucosidase
MRFWGLLAAMCLVGSAQTLPPEVRAAALVSRMTFAEKISQMQNSAPAIPRLGIPQYDWWNEALHGMARAGRATVFPQAIGLAATFDTDLMYRVADAISTEARAKYNEAQRQGSFERYFGLTFWSPNINIFRDPRWGRGQETYGEDPYLTSRMAVAFITGMQGNDPVYLKTVATAKHFAVHSGPEPLRLMFDVYPSEFDLEHTYLPAFRASVMEAKAGSVMCAYNSIDGVPACANPLLQTRLRDEWGFAGYVVSDCGAITDIAYGHGYASDTAEAAGLALAAGTDLSCGDEYGSLTESANVDRALVRLFTARFRLGMFDPPEAVPFSSIPYSENDSPAHRALALEAAQKAIVLLQNANGILPLAAGKRMTVMGPAADEIDSLLGNYNGVPSHAVTPLEGIAGRFGKVAFALGSTYTSSSYALVSTQAFPSGLKADFLNDGVAALSRTESRVYFNYDSGDPTVLAAIPRDHFAVRWSGTMVAPVSGLFSFNLARTDCNDCKGSDSASLLLDGSPVTGPVELQAGQSYALRIAYSQQYQGGTGIELQWLPPAGALLEEAARVAATSDVVLLCLGLNANLEGEQSDLEIPGFFHGDRTTLDLPQPQLDLLRTALDSGKPVVVLLSSGSAVTLGGMEARAAAILETWYGGEEAGTAAAQVLAGDVNPGGRLPVTFYRSVDQLPPFENYDMAGRTYRYFKGQPLWPFGYGLSYSTFTQSPPRVEGGRIHIQVRNDSTRDGDEVVQLYGRPVPELQGFRRVHLRAGEKQDVLFGAADPHAR